MTAASLPAPLAAAGIAGARDLDVRPVIERGGDPFQLILRTVQALGEREALHLIVGFEPAPLYGVLAAAGLAAHTERRPDAWHVFFYRDPKAPPPGPPPGAERAPLRPPVEMDVRDLEPPGPMIAILEKLADLGAGARLRVRHRREPLPLYDKLAALGFAARAERLRDGDYLIDIAPAWAFEK